MEATALIEFMKELDPPVWVMRLHLHHCLLPYCSFFHNPFSVSFPFLFLISIFLFLHSLFSFLDIFNFSSTYKIGFLMRSYININGIKSEFDNN